MNTLQSALPRHLRTFVEPQAEQLSLKMEPVRCGLYATLPESLGEGFLWTAAIDEDCLVSVHSLRLDKPLLLEERPTDFFCIFSGSRATLSSLPNAPVETPAEHENLVSFSHPGGSTRFRMQAGALYESTCITYTPDYFDKMKKRFPDDFEDMETAMRAFDSARPPSDMRSILRAFNPKRASLPGAAPYFHAKALEAMVALSARVEPDADAGAERTDLMIVHRAEGIIATRFSEKLTAQTIADELYVSRSRLYDAFKRVRGTGVTQRLRAERMKAACRLLCCGETNMEEVAHAVGYAHTSAFDEAFRRTFGCSPSRWRRCDSRPR